MNLPRALYQYWGHRSAALAIGWPGAESGTPPRLDGAIVVYKDGRCSSEVKLLGPAAAGALGAAVEALVPVARAELTSGEAEAPLAGFAFLPGECPTAGPTEVPLPPDLAWLDEELPETVMALQRDSRGAGAVLAPPDGRIETLWVLPDGVRQVWVWLQLPWLEGDPTTPAGFIVGAEIVESQSLRLLMVQRTPRYLWWYPDQMIDLDGDGSPEVLITTTDMGTPENDGLAILRRDESGDWGVWKESTTFVVHGH